MKARYHIAVSVALSGLLFAIFRSWGLAISSAVAGIFTDLDHVGDYLWQYGWRPDPRFFLRSFGEGRYRKIYIVLHGWEWAPLLAAACWLSDWNPWFVGLFFGFAQHLLLDQIFNPASPMCYFLSWRWYTGFSPPRAFPGQTWNPP